MGKSTVADVLRDRLRPAVRVNEDTIRYLALPRDLTDDSVVRAQTAGAELARAYAASGATAIIDGVLAGRTVVEAIVGRLRASGLPCRIFTLSASLEDLLRRNAARDPLVRLPDERIRLLFTDYDHAVGKRVDTGGLVAEETADNIQLLLAAGPAPRPRPGGLVLFLRHGAADVTTDPRLVERTFPRFYGRSYAEIAQEIGVDQAQRLLADSDWITPDGAKSMEDARDRVLAAGRDWRERAEDRLLVVSHGGPHGWLLCDLLGLPDQR